MTTVSDIPDAYLMCRDLGHNWSAFDVRVHRRLREIERVLRCRTCTTLRTQVLTLDGYLMPGRSFYSYPEQRDARAEPYLRKGVGRLSVDDRAAIRVASTHHMTPRIDRRKHA